MKSCASIFFVNHQKFCTKIEMITNQEISKGKLYPIKNVELYHSIALNISKFN